jgi:hypothetical protein
MAIRQAVYVPKTAYLLLLLESALGEPSHTGTMLETPKSI